MTYIVTIPLVFLILVKSGFSLFLKINVTGGLSILLIILLKKELAFDFLYYFPVLI